MLAAAFRQIAPGRLEVREGGGCLSLFGTPFFVAGVAVILMTLNVIPVTNPPESTTRFFMGLMGVAFAAIGSVLVFGRKWTTFNAADRTALVQYGLLVSMREKTLHLDGYTAVRIDFQPGDSDSADQYPVTLEGPGRSQLRLFASTKYAESRERAIAIGKLLNYTFEDATSSHGARLTAAQADLPLEHRLRLEPRAAQGEEAFAADNERIVAPASMQSRVTESNGVVTIVIPAARTHPALLVLFLIPVAIPLLLFEPFSRFFQQSKTPDVVSWFFLAFLVFMFGILPAQAALNAFLRSRLGRTTVTASTAGVRIEERRVWKTKTLASLAGTQIMEIDYNPAHTLASSNETIAEIQRRRPEMAAPPVGQGTERVLRMVRWLVGSGSVIIKTREGLTRFGQGLDDRELRYLHYIVRRALLGGAA
jgi:hypothetical protein